MISGFFQYLSRMLRSTAVYGVYAEFHVFLRETVLEIDSCPALRRGWRVCTVDQLLDKVLDQPVMVQRLVDGPDSADNRLEVGPGSAYIVVVPQ